MLTSSQNKRLQMHKTKHKHTHTDGVQLAGPFSHTHHIASMLSLQICTNGHGQQVSTSQSRAVSS